MKKILAVFAHPDDETFGPGGTLARYASEGVEIHILCATKGQAGELNGKFQFSNFKLKKESIVGQIREKELRKAAKILGVAKVEFLDFVDGRLCNAVYHELAAKIMTKIKKFKPDVIITLDRLGVSGHIDHMTVAMVTTYAHLKTKVAKKLYYLVMPANLREKRRGDYFIYFPEGYRRSNITTRIKYEKLWGKKKQAMLAHQSQKKDVDGILERFEKQGWPKLDYFILFSHKIRPKRLSENDIFEGITH
ncbi:PIG-L family deacetylase [Candidatus Gottesmanbacteria bacterium]|nr:PIG-L family deacetylase [Candidatus Gottesmanbacteria bacterium]